MNRIPIVLLCLTLALLLSSVGCSDDEDTSPSDEGLSVTVGALLPSTGALASYGEMSDAALEEAVAALEADGTSVDLLVEDTGTDPAAALEGLRSLQEEGVSW